MALSLMESIEEWKIEMLVPFALNLTIDFLDH